MTKSENAVISLSAIGAARPWSETNALLNAVRLTRSPRQWNGSSAGSPFNDCVNIGPFMGWKPLRPRGLGLGGGTYDPSGSPRSQASKSESPNRWHVPHD